MRAAIIGGTGVYGIGQAVEKEVQTQYGSVTVDIVTVEGKEIIFLPRHGKGHGLPPHMINYRANMMALKELEVTHVLATCAVGSCNDSMAPGDVMVIKDFLDFTKARPITFYDGGDGVFHTDVSDIYCSDLRTNFHQIANDFDIDVKGEGVYVCTEGPRFETASEIQFYKQIGGDVVGMTNVPESVLAKELNMCYAAVGIVTNWCTGVSGDIVMHDIQGAMKANKEKVTQAFISILTNKDNQDACACTRAVMAL